ncbi:MAG: universal stress protein [Nitrospira sp.]|nr:universal stress protein [Nitrospira sp.]
MIHARSRRRPSSILLATDFQQPAKRAFLHGVKLATALGARLEMLHVIKTPTDESGSAPDSRYLRSVKTAALLELGRLARVAKEGGASVHPLLRYGDPAACILETVERTHAGLIVMGTEGRIGWDRLRLGSAASAVVRSAPCPVLTVHGDLAGDVPRHPARVRLSRLLVATDFSRVADAAFRRAARLAVTLAASVRVVHAYAPSSDGRHAERKVEARVEELRRAGVEADARCLGGEPVETILAQAAAWQADLLAVGTQGRRGLHRLVLGSVAEELLKRAGCPVLTVGPKCSHEKRAWP